MNTKKFYIISEEVIPEVFIKVIKTKELINSNKVHSITEAVNTIGISRSTYYKYCDHIFILDKNKLGNKTTINLILSHKSGVLSNILDTIADSNGNILTITQNPPESGHANVSIHFDISNLKIPYNQLLNQIKKIIGVEHLTLVSME